MNRKLRQAGFVVLHAHTTAERLERELRQAEGGYRWGKLLWFIEDSPHLRWSRVGDYLAWSEWDRKAGRLPK